MTLKTEAMQAISSQNCRIGNVIQPQKDVYQIVKMVVDSLHLKVLNNSGYRLRITVDDVVGSSRKIEIAFARNIISHIAIENGYTKRNIQDVLNQNWTAVYHQLKKYKELVDQEDPLFLQFLSRIQIVNQKPIIIDEKN